MNERSPRGWGRVELTRDLYVKRVNQVALSMFRHPRSAFVGLPLSAAPVLLVVSGTHPAIRAIAGEAVGPMLVEAMWSNGASEMWVATASPSPDGAILSFITPSPEMLELYTERQRLRLGRDELATSLNNAKKEAISNPVTGQPNGRAYERALTRAVSNAHRHSSALSVVKLDADGFKPVNDRLGEHAADDVLRKICRLLEESARVGDQVFHPHGDEWSLLLPGADINEASAIAERARSAIADYNWPLPVTAKFGVASLALLHTPDQLDREADLALRAAKVLGPNRVVRRDEVPE